MNPRDISLKVFPDVIVKDSSWNVITLQWGQVVAHDMSFTADVPQTGIATGYLSKKLKRSLTGDIRVNQNPQLALMQNLLMRDHNWMAEQLCDVINPHWTDEMCYQEARRILIAKAQHITYYEFLHIFLGEFLML
ncbi:U4/U6 small nuclear ribonucleoprotein Prp3 [Operophtera brumata]|uniref:U4/U6 small nuclear ribonucleoprotein Prp3 n=1 Tax=Operophtera brumata TaxID=104452 RepID=A0A0L7LVI6_OPEBR|nr:U4/U6 small nuclear ribonucleoprotein Prp3 [Operophtera brumata]